MEVFISYADEDSELSSELEHRLRESGLIVHRDKSTLKAGDDWRERIFSKIRTCDAFLLLWSVHSARSRAVMEEIVEALRYERRILPCLIDSTEIIPLLADKHYYKLRNLSTQYADLLASFSLETDVWSVDSSRDLQSAISTYKAIVRKKYSHMQVLFLGKERAMERAYIELALTPGLEIDMGRGDVSPRELLGLTQNIHANYIIAGHPGTGKTCTLHYLLHLWSIAESNIILIYARLKDFEPRFYTDLSDFLLEQLYTPLQPHVRQIFEHAEILHNYRCLILLDGLDEIPAGNYQAFHKSLSEFMEKYRLCNFIITTRIDGFKDQREEDFLRWDILAIARLDDTKISSFISLWFSDLQKEGELLKKMQNPRIHDLAGRAFLLALICLVFEEEGVLGQNRSALYEQATLYLEKSRSGKLPNKILEARREAMKQIGLRFLQLNTIEMNEKLLVAIVSSILPSEIIGSSIREFVEGLVNDTGVLQNLGGVFIFTHKSFMEYYAALALKDLASGQELLLDYCHVSFWEETIRLYAGSIRSRSDQESFIAALWKRNSALALRTANECHRLAPTFLGGLISGSSSENRRRMISEVQDSLRSFDLEDAKRLTIETLAPLFARESDSAVLYFSIQLLKEFDPEDSGGIMSEFFYKAADDLYVKLTSNPAYKFEFVSISSGQFLMGDNRSPDKIERPAHKVYIDEFCACKYQLTNLAYEAIMGNEQSKRDQSISEKDDQPTININWFDAYICALKVGCRLPTEAEWEYMARSGSTGDWCFGSKKGDLKKYCNYEESKIRATWPVGSGLPNNWGLYDVHGNVWEWCQDWLGPYTDEFQRNPKGPPTGTRRVRRGGGHAYHARGCRSAFRWGNDPAYSFKDIGVRLVKDG